MNKNFSAADYLDFVSEKRTDETWLKEQFLKESSIIIPVKNQKSLCMTSGTPRAVFLNINNFIDHDDAYNSSVFLGIYNTTAYFAVDAELIKQEIPVKENSEYIDMWPVLSLMDQFESSVLSLARFMVFWNSRNTFCGKCGGLTKKSEGGHVRICINDKCRQNFFPSMDPAIIVLVSHGEYCLLGRQKSWPNQFMYSTLAGFVEPAENIEDAVAREVMEESGVEIASVQYDHSQPWLFPASLMFGFYAQAKNDLINVNKDEMDDVRWFTRDEIKEKLENGKLMLPPSVSISYRLIEGWFDRAGEIKLADIKAKLKM